MRRIVYQANADGYYIGTAEADESPLEPGVYLIPAGCIETPPPTIENGQVARLVDGHWSVERIPKPGAAAPDRRAEIEAELTAIDAASARPMRAIVGGTATQDDRDRLADLETQASTLRAELSALSTSPPSAPSE